MDDRHVALLAGVNVGTAKRVAMADLRTLVEGLGYGDVRTVLNSGNVVFTARTGTSGAAAARIEKAIAVRLGVATRVTVLSGKEVGTAVRRNPFAATANDPSRLLIMASPDPAVLVRLRPLCRERWSPEALALGPRVAYLWCADGVARSPLWTAVKRALGGAGTARNLSTMTKLLALIEGSSCLSLPGRERP